AAADRARPPPCRKARSYSRVEFEEGVAERRPRGEAVPPLQVLAQEGNGTFSAVNNHREAGRESRLEIQNVKVQRPAPWTGCCQLVIGAVQVDEVGFDVRNV